MLKPNIVFRKPLILFLIFIGLMLGVILFFDLKHLTRQNSQGPSGSAWPETVTIRERQHRRHLVGKINTAFNASDLASALGRIQFEWQTSGEEMLALADQIPLSDIPTTLKFLKKQVGTETVLEFEQLLLFTLG